MQMYFEEKKQTVRIYLKYSYSSVGFCNGMSETLYTVLCRPFTK